LLYANSRSYQISVATGRSYLARYLILLARFIHVSEQARLKSKVNILSGPLRHDDSETPFLFLFENSKHLFRTHLIKFIKLFGS
jgi:hypothetical protein